MSFELYLSERMFGLYFYCDVGKLRRIGDISRRINYPVRQYVALYEIRIYITLCLLLRMFILFQMTAVQPVMNEDSFLSEVDNNCQVMLVSHLW